MMIASIQPSTSLTPRPSLGLDPADGVAHAASDKLDREAPIPSDKLRGCTAASSAIVVLADSGADADADPFEATSMASAPPR
jgi:hypothetical protein